MASLVAAALILLATFFLLPWLYFLPKCVLGSMYVPSLTSEFSRLNYGLYSICLVVWSLLAETPHDVAYYWQ